MNEAKPSNVHPVFLWLAGFIGAGCVIAALYFAYVANQPGNRGSVLIFMTLAIVFYSVCMRNTSMRNVKLNAGGVVGGVAGALMGLWVEFEWNTTVALTPLIIVGALAGNLLWGS
jgi:hypothetical protein